MIGDIRCDSLAIIVQSDALLRRQAIAADVPQHDVARVASDGEHALILAEGHLGIQRILTLDVRVKRRAAALCDVQRFVERGCRDRVDAAEANRSQRKEAVTATGSTHRPSVQAEKILSLLVTMLEIP